MAFSNSASTPLKGLVLAGGQSRRMGADKAALQAGGASLLDRAVSAMQAVLDDVYVAIRAVQADDPVRQKYAVIEDAFSDVGPAAGLLAAHARHPDVAWLVIACDMPLLDEISLACLRDGRDEHSDATALAAEAGGRPEPLCAIYEPGTLAAFLVQVNAGGNPSPSSWLAAVQTRILVAPDPGALVSANTQAELADMMHKIESRPDAANRKLR
jgi:molybdopterin-guanine dinucleotide biosynthesis protein A